MTLEEAKSLMLKKGASKIMADSKTLAFALDVFGDTDLYTESWEAQRKLKELVDDVYKKEIVLQELEKRITKASNELLDIQRNIRSLRDKQAEEDLEYIEEWKASLKQCETQEGRDTLRLMQVFVNSVDIKTAYDNTAYINGISTILSGGKAEAMPEKIKKVEENKRRSLGEVQLNRRIL